MDSHDTDRLASMIVNAGRRPYSKPDRFDYDAGNVSPRYISDYDVQRPNDRERRVQRLVALLQMTYVGAPMIYYGTEAGMWGGDDPCDRMPMVWPELSYDSQQADPLGRPRQANAVAFDVDLFKFYQAAIKLRRDSMALRRGEIEFIAADDQAEFLGFRRSDGYGDTARWIESGRRAVTSGRLPLATGERVSQVFTASGEVAKFPIEQKAPRRSSRSRPWMASCCESSRRRGTKP